MLQAQLITDEYRRLNSQLHADREDYGTASLEWAKHIMWLANKSEAKNILDYGCGKGRLGKVIGSQIEVINYDPAIPVWSARPEPADLVACVDVLEHIEPDCLDAVLDDLQRLTRRVGFFSIGTKPAGKTLADGRNAHLIVEDYRWWLPKLWDRFDIGKFTDSHRSFYVMVSAKQ